MSLQETLLNDNDKITFKKYNTFNKTNVSPVDGRAVGGSSILIKADVPHESVTLNTSLQAVAVRVHLHKTITVSSLYIPPKYKLNSKELDELFNQLPSPVLLLGDFNAHSDIWGCNNTDNRGKQIIDFISQHDLCILNNKTSTYLHPSSGSFSSIDLSICSPSIFMDFVWKVGEDQCGSDHFPIFINTTNPVTAEKSSNWQLHRADWATFRSMCEEQINRFQNDIHTIEDFTSRLTNIALKTVPKSSKIPKPTHKPWFNADCENAIKERKKTLNTFKRKPTQANLDQYRAARAKARRTIKESKRKS